MLITPFSVLMKGSTLALFCVFLAYVTSPIAPMYAELCLSSPLRCELLLLILISHTSSFSCSQDMQDNYSFLLTVYDKLLETLQDGVTLSDVYSTVVQFVEEQKPHLKDYFTKSLGYGILLIGLSTPSILTRFATGLEFREPSLVISPKCSLCAKEGCASL